jgi:type IV fimbrial biogenesis protein FimT
MKHALNPRALQRTPNMAEAAPRAGTQERNASQQYTSDLGMTCRHTAAQLVNERLLAGAEETDLRRSVRPNGPAGAARDNVRDQRQAGFSLLEICVVLVIAMIVMAIAIPLFSETIREYRLRSSASDLATFLQRARMQAVRDNRFYTVRTGQVGSTPLVYSQFYVDVNGNATADSGDVITQLPGQVTLVPAPSGGSALSASVLGFTPQASPVGFNGRGTPCVVNGTVCVSWGTSPAAPAGFVYYLQANTGELAAVSVSPTGRIHTWTRQGSTWQ